MYEVKFLVEAETGITEYTTFLNHIKEQTLIQKQPSNLEGCFCIYARKA